MEHGRIYDNNDGLLQIALESPGCTYGKQGHCKMCFYGAGKKITTDEAVTTVERAFMQVPNPESVLIGSFGSPLDEAEVDRDVLKAALEKVAEHQAKNVYVETHYETITPESLQFLKDALPGKRITIEMGLESANENVIKNVINKKLGLNELAKTIELIHARGMFVALNVLYGLWYDKREMQMDFLSSCIWADRHGADEIVAFMLNVKPGTYLETLFNAGQFIPPSHRDFITTFSKLDDCILSKLYFSWFGERQYLGKRLECTPPDFDGLDPETAIEFYHNFMNTTDVVEKRCLIATVLRT